LHTSLNDFLFSSLEEPETAQHQVIKIPQPVQLCTSLLKVKRDNIKGQHELSLCWDVVPYNQTLPDPAKHLYRLDFSLDDCKVDITEVETFSCYGKADLNGKSIYS